MGGANLYHHQHNRATGKTVSKEQGRMRWDGILRLALFQRMDQDLTSPVERPCSPSRHYPRRQTRLSIIDSEEDSSSDENSTQPLTNMSSHEEDSISSDGDVSFHQKNPNTAYTFVDNKENEESSDDEMPP
jgi:hypothetical protein